MTTLELIALVTGAISAIVATATGVAALTYQRRAISRARNIRELAKESDEEQAKELKLFAALATRELIVRERHPVVSLDEALMVVIATLYPLIPAILLWDFDAFIIRESPISFTQFAISSFMLGLGLAFSLMTSGVGARAGRRSRLLLNDWKRAYQQPMKYYPWSQLKSGLRLFRIAWMHITILWFSTRASIEAGNLHPESISAEEGAWIVVVSFAILWTVFIGGYLRDFRKGMRSA